METIYIESDEALIAKTKHYFRLWAKQRKPGCAHPNQSLTARVCWLQSKLLQRFKCGIQLPREVMQYLVGYKIAACTLLGRKYLA